jgi:hypothetical protein
MTAALDLRRLGTFDSEREAIAAVDPEAVS